MRKVSASILAVLLVAGLITGVETVTVEPAQAASTKRLVTGSTVSITATNVRAITHPGNAAMGIVAPASDPIAIAQAAALANISGAAVIVSASITDAADVNTVVAQKNITNLTFIGAATQFPQSYRNAIDSRVTTKTAVLNNSPFERSKLLAPADTTAFVIAKGSNVPAMEAALSYSSATSSALLVITGAEPANSVKNYLSPVADPKVTLAGDPGVSDQLETDDTDHYGELLVDSVVSTNSTYDNIVQLHVDQKGRAVNSVSVAPGGDLASFALATLVGRAEGSVTLPAGAASSITTNSPADYHLQLLKSELKNLTLVGTATTNAQLTVVAEPSATARTAAPAWTITNTTLGTGSYSITFTARAGATMYRVLNWDNSVVASTSSTTITLPGTPDYMTLAAFDSSNAEIDRIYYRSNTYDAPADRGTAITGTIQNGTANLRILGPTGVPRKIVRTMFDPYAMMDDEPTPPQTVAITCTTNYTETGLDPEVQWTYQVVNLTLRTGSGCGTTVGSPIGGTGLPVAAVSLPLTQDPWAQARIGTRGGEDLQRPRQGDATTQPFLPRPGQTLSDAARQQLAYEELGPEEAVVGSSALRASGTTETMGAPVPDAVATAAATGSQFVFSYQAYIPEAVVVGPGHSLNPFKPVIVYNGSDRAWWDVNNIHTKFDMRAYVGDTQIFPTKFMGETKRWHCGPNFFRQTTECELVGTATASLNELAVSGTISGSTTTINFTAHATNPLEPFAAAIDGQMKLTLTPRSWNLYGTHDRMPVHQFWWSPIYSEGTLAYTSQDFYKLYCLIPGTRACTAVVNVRL